MEIRKLFKVENAHVVRNCSTSKCSESIHGHSVKIELVLEGSKLDDAGMLYDFGLLKEGPIGDFIDSLDHCYLLCSKDNKDFRNMIKNNSSRWIEFPFNPTAECMAIFIHVFVNKILDHIIPSNNEGPIHCSQVIYHETDTGYAKATDKDAVSIWKNNWYDILFSDNLIESMRADTRKIIFENAYITNKLAKKQIQL